MAYGRRSAASFRAAGWRLALAAAVGVLVWALPAAWAHGEEQPPNIVFILADDMGWNDIGYHGSQIMTPNLDRLAAEGGRFTEHYAYATCSPTRVALLTGRNPARYRVFGPLASTTRVRPEDMHLPSALQELGYTTHISGKWHIGETEDHRPLRHGFDTSYGYLRGQIDPYTHRYKFGDHVTWHRNDVFVEEDGHVTRLITDEAVRVIEEVEGEADTPFFLYVAHHAPHYPLNEPPKYIEPYKEVFEDVWRRHFAASITHMDEQIGRIVDALEQTGQRGNTIIIFASDNGGQRSWSAPEREYNGRYAAHETLGDNTPFRGWKASLYEGGIRVPALVNFPGVVPSGGTIDGPTHMLDWAPTLIGLAGGEVSEEWDLHGQDILPLILGQIDDIDAETEHPARLYFNHGNRQWAFREGEWKLLMDRNERIELFNLADDPEEQHELSEEEAERAQRLRQALERQREKDG